MRGRAAAIVAATACVIGAAGVAPSANAGVSAAWTAEYASARVTLDDGGSAIVSAALLAGARPHDPMPGLLTLFDSDGHQVCSSWMDGIFTPSLTEATFSGRPVADSSCPDVDVEIAWTATGPRQPAPPASVHVCGGIILGATGTSIPFHGAAVSLVLIGPATASGDIGAATVTSAINGSMGSYAVAQATPPVLC